jgi:predicted phage-related endonuclease
MDLELKRTRIGGSEVAPIFGIDDFGSTEFSVWYRKKGGGQGEDSGDNQRAMVGKALEPGILDLYTRITGRKVEYHDRTIVDPARPYMAATPDALCIGERRGVDAKLVYWDQHKLWGETANEIPHRVVMQAWWYMAAFDYDVWDICALVGLDPRVYTIHRDREAEQRMLEHVERWHAKYILGDAIPPLGRSADAARWLQRMYPNHKRPDLREAEFGEVAMLENYVHLRLTEKLLKATKFEMETALKAAIKDREGLTWLNGEAKFTWRKTKDGEETDWESLALGLLYGLVKDEKERAQKLADHTTPKIGERRLRIEHPALRKGASSTPETEAA